MSILLSGVTKLYDGLPVVREVELEIATGELFVLLGPSGSGKSTLLRMIAGLVPVDGGRIFLHGREVTRVSPKDRGVGFVFQHYALFRNMTVAENVEFPLAVRRLPRAQRRHRREELLELVGLTGFGRRRPGQLSGGQQQRVALARALAHQPPVLLLDEPFGALDARIRVELRQTIRRIQRELALTTVFVTHDQEEAFALADRLAILDRGRILEVGAPEELYLRPRSERVATFLGAANLLVGDSNPHSVRLGPVEIPLTPEADPGSGRRRVQVLFRPEDVEVGPAGAEPESPLLGRGRVEEVTFAGGAQRLRLSLPRLDGVRPVAPPAPFGAPYFWVDAVRPQHEAHRLPLSPGAQVQVGVRRVHLLQPAALRLLVRGGEDEPGRAAAAFARALAARTGARLTFQGAFGALGEPPEGQAGGEAGAGEAGAGATADHEVAVVGWAPEGPAAALLERPPADADHLLVVQGPAPAPEHLLVCVAVGEPGKTDVSFAERLAWQLGAQATLLTVLPERLSDEPLPEHVQRFLDAGSRALSARGVETRTRVRYGGPRREILAELAEGTYDLLVVGTPVPPAGAEVRLAGLVAHLLAEKLPCPLLVVRAPGDEATA